MRATADRQLNGTGSAARSRPLSLAARAQWRARPERGILLATAPRPMPFPHSDACDLRLARDEDSPGIVALVGLCFRPYAHCWLDVNREEPGLLSPTRAFARFWVLVHRERVFATIACTEHAVDAGDGAGPRPGVELKKCYVHPALRRQGVAKRLVGLVEDHARAGGRPLVELWSDTRFETAHAVYAGLGYWKTGERRALHDISDTEEFRFVKQLAP